MKQDIADRLEILEGQRAEAKQLRKQARRAHRNNEAELLTKYISFTNYCIYECYGNDSNLLIVFYVQIMPDDFVM
ncbi:hypothetical protein BMT65_21015, partial [Escherichia coli]|uniref:hypothetical protein n=2 Tax=Escherichia coli TaxID=562 RepID=UPI0009CAD992